MRFLPNHTDSDRLLELAFENAPIGMALLSPDGVWLQVNPAICEMIGLPEAEVIGRNVREFTDRDDAIIEDRAMAEIRSGARDRFELEKRYVRADGELRWAWRSVAALRDEAGEVVCLVSQVKDITDRRLAEMELSASEQRYRRLLASLPDAAVLAFDRELRFLVVEGSALESIGYRAGDLVGRTVREALSGEAAARVEPLYRRALAGETLRFELRSGRGDRPFAVEISPVCDDDDRIVGGLVVARDISERLAAEASTRAAEQRFEIAFDRAPIGMVIVGPDGRFKRVNKALTDMTGYTSQQLTEMEPFTIVHPDDRADVAPIFAALGHTTDDIDVEHRMVQANGDPVWVHAKATLIRDAAGEPMHVLSQVQDVTERRHREARLEHLADHDALTGLLNRRGFGKALDAHLARVRRYGAQGALLIADLDGFKAVNDELGHSAGDELIARCASALTDRLRQTDVLARLGGDEFAVLLPCEGREQSRVAADAVANVIRETAASYAGSRAAPVTASIGVAVFPAQSLSAEAMLSAADAAMYDAKRAGRDRVAFAP